MLESPRGSNQVFLLLGHIIRHNGTLPFFMGYFVRKYMDIVAVVKCNDLLKALNLNFKNVN